jgi:hypothetical protein
LLNPRFLMPAPVPTLDGLEQRTKAILLTDWFAERSAKGNEKSRTPRPGLHPSPERVGKIRTRMLGSHQVFLERVGMRSGDIRAATVRRAAPACADIGAVEDLRR